MKTDTYNLGGKMQARDGNQLDGKLSSLFTELCRELGNEFLSTVHSEGLIPLSGLTSWMEILKKDLKLAVIYGGDKTRLGAVLNQTDNLRPWKSYYEVALDIQRALLSAGFEDVHVLPEDMGLIDALKKNSIQFAWLNTAGVQGENSISHCAGLLEMLGIPYVGHCPLDGAMLDSKEIFKMQLNSLGILTPEFLTWHPNQGSLDGKLKERFRGYDGPFVVKPVSGRASLNVHHVKNCEGIADLSNEVFSITHQPILIEKYIAGREFCVAVCGSTTFKNGRFYGSRHPFAFAALERRFEDGEKIFTSMDKKSIGPDRAHLLDERDKELRERLFALAEKVYTDCGLKTLIRIDVRADESGQLYILEANPKPDLKNPTSLIAMGLPLHGITYNDLIYGLLGDRIFNLLVRNPSKVKHLVNPDRTMPVAA